MHIFKHAVFGRITHVPVSPISAGSPCGGDVSRPVASPLPLSGSLRTNGWRNWRSKGWSGHPLQANSSKPPPCCHLQSELQQAHESKDRETFCDLCHRFATAVASRRTYNKRVVRELPPAPALATSTCLLPCRCLEVALIAERADHQLNVRVVWFLMLRVITVDGAVTTQQTIVARRKGFDPNEFETRAMVCGAEPAI